MSRKDAERFTAGRNALSAAQLKGRSYRAERTLTAESEWAIVTYVAGKPTYREY
ncbi:MAG: hypothetical protein H0X34_07065 [Chthoniobacterales bacterium]|nr:hypothetical protein [Chthoniobacterales bacterium]